MMNKKKLFYIIFCIIFLITLLFSNRIIILLLKNNFIETTVSIVNLKKDDVDFCIDDLNCHTDIFDSFNLDGWAFCETLIDNDNKEVYAFLINDKNIYRTKMELMRRDDIARIFGEKQRVRGRFHGFSELMSTVGVKNGIYELYLYCKENDENFGLVNTGIMLKKEAHGMSKYTWVSTLSNISSPVEDKQARNSIDSVNITTEGYLQIVGWSFIDGLDASDQSVYVRLSYDKGTTTTYSTQSVLRRDVGKVFKNDLYNNSGFKAVMPADEVPDGDIMIEVLVENGGKIYLASNVYMYSSDASDVTNEKDSIEAAETEITEKNSSDEVEINSDNITADSNIKYCIDSCAADSLLSIKGWVFTGDKNASDTSVNLAVTKADGSTRVFTTVKSSRPDVAKAYENELYTESGFTASIPIDAISEGENTITVIADNGQQLLKAEKPYKYSYIPENNKQ